MSRGTATKFETLKPGVQGTRQTLDLMTRQVRDALLDPSQPGRRVALEIVHNTGVRGGDRIGEARALFEWVLAHVEFRRDPTDVQLAVDPRVLLAAIEAGEWAAGNCVAQSELLALLGHSLRLPIDWVILGDSPDSWGHVYPAMDLKKYGTAEDGDSRDRLGMDTAVEHPTFGEATEDAVPGTAVWAFDVQGHLGL